MAIFLCIPPHPWCDLATLTDSIPSEGVNYDEIDAKDPETLTEVEKIALLGRPRLGDITKVQIRIRESKEFKVSATWKKRYRVKE